MRRPNGRRVRDHIHALDSDCTPNSVLRWATDALPSALQEPITCPYPAALKSYSRERLAEHFAMWPHEVVGACITPTEIGPETSPPYVQLLRVSEWASE